MKKILCALLICVSLTIFAKPSVAGTCEGGSEFQGVLNGHTYCVSEAVMTWWAAFAWCKKQDRKLASMNQLCPGWAGATGDGVCPNMTGGDQYVVGWSSNPSGASAAFFVNLSIGHVSNVHYRSINYRAICY